RDGGATRTDLVGQTCVYDTVAEAMELGPLEPGDLVALLDHGAYCDTSGTQTNAVARPGVVLADAGRATLVRRPQTLADAIGRAVVPPERWRTRARVAGGERAARPPTGAPPADAGAVVADDRAVRRHLPRRRRDRVQRAAAAAADVRAPVRAQRLAGRAA